jgi:prephenate dehydrogenase
MAGQIAIIGLGQIGASVGMALKKANSSLRRIGFDKDPGVLSAAESLDAIDQAVRRLPDAVRDADIVLLALPLGQIPETVKYITSYLKENAVIMETTPVKAALVQSLREGLPEGRYFIGLVPAITPDALADPDTGLKAARPDLFRRTVMMIDIPRGSSEEVEQLAVNFVKLLGAKPMLADLAESDGLMTTSHILPQLTAAALLHATVDQPGWSDGRKLAGKPFAGVTGGMAYYDDPSSLKAAILSNPRAVVHALDVLIAALTGMREDVENGDEQAIGARLQMAYEARERWLNERSSAEWLREGGEPADVPNAGEQMMQMLFGDSLIQKMKGKKKEEKG